jgi:spermidine synthase
MMFAMGLGAGAQRRLLGDLLDKFLIIEILLGFLGGISALAIYASFAWTASYHTVLYGFAMLIGVFIGLEIPILIRINTDYAQSLRVNLSEILCMDYIGALLGALLFTYFLLTRLSLGRIGLVLGLANTFLAVAGLTYFWPLVRRRRIIAAACLASFTILTYGLVRADDWMIRMEQRCYVDPIIHSETSRYQHLVLTRRGDVLKFFINGHLQFSSSDESIYHDMLVHVPMAVAQSRHRVLILGGGDGLALREVLHYPDVQQVTLVDIDPAVIGLASEHPEMIRLNEAALHDARVRVLEPAGMTPAGRITISAKTKLAAQLLDDREYPLAEVSVYLIDADLFVQKISGTYDVAILDFPDPGIVELAKLYSLDFYRSLANRLAPHGILSVQSTSPYHATKAFLCIGKTLEAAGYRSLPYRQNVPSFGEWGWYLAWRDARTPEEMKGRVHNLAELPVMTSYLTPETMRGAFAFGKGLLEIRGEDIKPNTKLQPVLLEYYQRDWK